MLLRSFFSATMRFSRRYCANTGAGRAILAIAASPAVEAGRQQGQLVGISHCVAGGDMAIAMPGGAWLELPVARLGCQVISRHIFPSCHDVAVLDGIRNERIKEPLAFGISFGLLELPRDGAQLLPEFDAQADRVVPQHFPLAPLHHLGTDVQGMAHDI